MRVVVLGARGQLGTDIVLHCSAAGDDVLALGHDELDITNAAEVSDVLAAFRPGLVINCAAWTAVDACEGAPDRADAVNAVGAAHVAHATAQLGAHLVHLSTDYVFDGRLDRPYREDDPANPLGAYGRSKLAGEVAVRALSPDATVVRTSWVCGEHGANMVKTALALAAQGRDLRFVDDQRGCPTFTSDLAPLVRHLGCEQIGGTVHATNQRAVSWYDFVREILECAGEDPSRVSPISTDELQPPRPAPRPANSVLDNMVLRSLGIPLLPDFRQPLERLVRVLGRQ